MYLVNLCVIRQENIAHRSGAIYEYAKPETNRQQEKQTNRQSKTQKQPNKSLLKQTNRKSEKQTNERSEISTLSIIIIKRKVTRL